VRESAVRMLRKGVPTHSISDWLQLPLEKVQEFQKSII
jgi:hypothetical protein